MSEKVFCKDCRWGKLNCIHSVECRNPKFLEPVLKEDLEKTNVINQTWGELVSKPMVGGYVFGVHHNAGNDCGFFVQRVEEKDWLFEKFRSLIFGRWRKSKSKAVK